MTKRPGRGHLLPHSFLSWPTSRRTPVSVAVTVAAVAGSIAAAAGAARPPAELPRLAVARYLGGDGERVRGLADDGPLVRETAHLVGTRVLQDGPDGFFLGMPDLAEVQYRHWLVETDDRAGGRRHRLQALTEDGLRTQAIGGPASMAEAPEQWRAFQPALLDLPADPAPGQRFSSAGRVISRQGAPEYTDQASIEAAPTAGADCLRIRHRLEVTGEPALDSVTVRCPGRGVVAVEGDWTETDPLPPAPGGPVPPAPAPVSAARHPDRQPIQRGGTDLVITSVGAPQPAPQGWWVGNRQSGNVLLLTPRTDPTSGGRSHVPTSFFHPGGDLTMVSGCDGLVVAGTTQRRLVAHDANGHWRWSANLVDVARSAVRQGEQRLLVTSLDGALTAVDCRTGGIDWRIANIASSAPVATGETVRGAAVAVAADREVRLLDDGGTELWRSTLPDTANRLLITPAAVLVSDRQGMLHAFDPASGRPLWTTRATETATGLHRLGEVVLVRTDEGLDGLRISTGERLWRRELANEVGVDDGSRLWLAGPGGAQLVDAGGRVEALGPLPPRPGGGGLVPVRTERGLLLLDSLGLTRWEAG